MTQTGFERMKQETASDGGFPQIIRLQNSSGMQIYLMDIGATWLSCRVPLADGEVREVLLGVDSYADFVRQQSYLGVTVGRYANRIANATFSVNGKSYQLNANQNGNCLHGGAGGFHCRRWQVSHQTDDSVRFSLISEHGDQGFPGKLEVSVTYSLSEENQVSIDYQADTDQVTPVNLTNHTYFNLGDADNGETCLEHDLWIDADSFLPVNAHGLPQSKGPAAVAGTGFDFRKVKTIGQDLGADALQKLVKGYDHAYVFHASRDVASPVAVLISPDERVRLFVKTTMPAMQLYTGNWLDGTPGRKGRVYADYAGVALETQFLPDAPNHREWEQPDCMLTPDTTYRHQTIYQFKF